MAEMISGMAQIMESGQDLARDMMSCAISEMLQPGSGDAEKVRFLEALTSKGETDSELHGMLDGMEKHMLKAQIASSEHAIDMCGTGGDRMRTFNISTAASFVASVRVPVAKHGNKSSSGGWGSADVFEHLGYDMNASLQEMSEMLEKCGICFLFAPRFHPAMKHAAAARKMIPQRTAFNILGPLLNPAGVKSQFIGVSSHDLLARIPRMLQERGSECVMTGISASGMDELTTASRNRVCLFQDGTISEYEIDPQELGLHHADLSDIQVSTSAEAAAAFFGALNGTANTAMQETVALNAAAGLIVGGAAGDFDEAVETALDIIESGEAYNALSSFASKYGNSLRLKS